MFILLDFLRAWLQIGCKNVLSICYQNDLNMCIGNAAEESAAFFQGFCVMCKKMYMVYGSINSRRYKEMIIKKEW